MIFGDKNFFAVECGFTAQIGLWIYGTFRVWLDSHPIGTYSEEVIDLKSTTGVSRGSIEEAPPTVTSLTSLEFIDAVWSATYDGNQSDETDPHLTSYVWFDSCEGFENVRSVIAKQGNKIRIVWQLRGQPSPRECCVSFEAYEAVRTSFIAWLDRELAERRKSSDQ